jgi:hypothetical protein
MTRDVARLLGVARSPLPLAGFAVAALIALLPIGTFAIIRPGLGWMLLGTVVWIGGVWFLFGRPIRPHRQ